MNVPAFDYSGLDLPTRDTLHWAEKEIGEARRDYIARIAQAVSIAHDALCSTGVRNSDSGKYESQEDTFISWCKAVGLSKTTAYQLLQVQALLTGSTPEEQATLEAASPSLLYAAAKPSAPAELVQAVKAGDITTHKQYQELLAKLKAAQSDKAAAESMKDSALETLRQAQADAAQANDKVRAAENRAVGAQKLADQRGAENAELRRKLKEAESRPIDIAVAEPSEADKERWRKEGEDRMAATLQDAVLKAHKAKITAENQVADLQEQLAAARPDADACQRTADTLYETTENLRLLLRTQLKLAQLPPDTYGKVVAHVLQAADALRDTVRSCAPAGYTMDDEEEDFL